MATEITVGIAGAAGDGLDRSGDTLARTAARLGLHVFTYNAYQSLIRGGHTWLKIRIGEDKVTNHGDRLDVLIALNQDSIERHAGEVEEGGAIIFNGGRFTCDPSLVRDGVTVLPLPMKEFVKDMGRVPPVMQNTVAVGALLYLLGFDIEVTSDILAETFRHKGEEIVSQNVGLLRAGHAHAAHAGEPLAGYDWTFSRRARPMITGNMMTALGAVAAGCKFYAAYPMSPATSILHWMADHTEQVGVVVKQAEDEIAAINLAIGAGHAGVRALTATSGGGFALMTEAIGMAGMIETPVVVVNVMRGGPSTGLPTKTEQGDLNQAIGASQGDFPRVIVAPKDAADCFSTMVESFNLAEKWQLPVIVLSDLYLGEHRSTLDSDRVSHDVPIDRGEWASEDDAATNHAGGFLRYRITDSGVSPRARAGQKGLQHTSATDEHDERGVLVSDEHSNAAIRRKMIEKRMRKMDGVLASLPAPAIEGPADAEATLIGWGSMWGVINEAGERLRAAGIPVNQLHFKWLWPFHETEARALLEACNRTVVVEANFSGQFARHLRAETGFTVDDVLLKYDGEPIEPQWVVAEVKRVLQGAAKSLDVDETEVREMAYHFIRIHLKDQVRPVRYEHVARNGSEAVWNVDLVDRKEATPRGRLVIGHESGKLHAWEPTA